jgi:cytochrome c peroxidase
MKGNPKRQVVSIRKLPMLVSLLIFTIAIFLISFNTTTPSPEEKIRATFKEQLDDLKASMESFKKDILLGKDSLWKNDFIACRKIYKKAECFIAYKYPLIAKRLNGPALMDAELVDPNESVMPTGFQVIEEDLQEEDLIQKTDHILKQVDHVITYISLLQRQINNFSLGRSELYEALKLNLCTMASLGLSGFDAPLMNTSIDEIASTLESTLTILQNTGENSPEINKAIQQCLYYCRQDNVTFENFDRARFLVHGLKPLFSALYNHQLKRNIPFINKRSAIKTTAKSFFDKGAFDPYFFAPDSVTEASKGMIALGKALFSEITLSSSGRSCASCHHPEKAYTDGLERNLSLQRDEHLPRNTPTVINAALQPVLFADSRVKYLEDQAHDVILNKHEMDGNIEQALQFINSSAKYTKLCYNAFPGKKQKITRANIIEAIAAFERSLIKLDAPFDQYMRGDTVAMSAQQIQGFNLFMGKAKCGTCHFMPLFNGAVPPFYDRQDAEIIGVPGNTSTINPQLDNDLGVYDLFHNELKKGAFKTPSIRNAAWTAPYMHNGVYKSLDEVIDFYDKGGGKGLGIKMQQQTLPEEKLNLKPQEKAALIAFIKALSDK